MKNLTKLCLGATAFAVALAAHAEITLYGQEGLRGRAFTFDESVPNFRGTRLDERASSLVVHRGTWQVCSEPYYAGVCATVGPGEYPSLRSAGLDNRISSIREIQWQARAPARQPGLVLFEQSNFAGRSISVDGIADSLGQFNDRARSMIVYDGEWELCEHDRFRGNCMVFREGRHAHLGPLSADVSSVRQLSTSAPPAPGPGHGQIGGWGSGSRAVLYEGRNFRGREIAVTSDLIADLRDAGFDNQAASLRVEGGEWVLCSEPNFQGRCFSFGPGDYPVLPSSLDERVSSARRVHESAQDERRSRRY